MTHSSGRTAVVGAGTRICVHDFQAVFADHGARAMQSDLYVGRRYQQALGGDASVGFLDGSQQEHRAVIVGKTGHGCVKHGMYFPHEHAVLGTWASIRDLGYIARIIFMVEGRSELGCTGKHDGTVQGDAADPG
jgi:hypothetical protein